MAKIVEIGAEDDDPAESLPDEEDTGTDDAEALTTGADIDGLELLRIASRNLSPPLPVVGVARGPVEGAVEGVPGAR